MYSISRHIAFLLTAVLFLGCGSETTDDTTTDDTSGNYVVKGNITDGAGQTIKIEKYIADKYVQMGSASIGVDGAFELRMEEPGYEFYRVSLVENNYAWIIVKPGDEPFITGNAADLAMSYDVTGSKDSEILRELFSEMDAYNIQIEQITNDLSFLSIADSVKKRELLYAADSIKMGFRSYLLEFIDLNPTSPACISVFEYFKGIEDVAVAKKIRDNLSGTYSNSPYYALLEMHILNMDRQLAELYAPEIELPTPSGETLALSSLRGKTVLIDFWASWCKPCRAANPEVVKLYNTYKDQGFTVFSVSLDGHPQDPDPKASWMAAIEQDGLVWPNHVSDLRFWESQVVNTYNFGQIGIPYTVLIDPEGKIIAKGLRGPDLIAKVEAIFGA